MKHLIFQTNNTWTGTLLRWTIGIVFIPHGLQKTLGLFGGMGWSKTMDFFTESLHLPYFVAFTVILVEFLGSVSLLLGWGTRFWALSFIGLLTGIMFTSHWDNGFFMNWFGTQKGEGCQFDILAIGIVVALLIEGGGKLSVDRWISSKNILKKES
ncbi:DoxX family protein [Chryseobacterium sp. Bi04]|uniref:DoxX family protein n=1 Tax=Chryseobacterium sp. Bi04 TaxID=2822345 RepID=UPI001D43BDDD|nr:DoxX family protein [Chryseobacterium sp. Bi04]CAH0165970.1 Putative oxidoreductase CatD [Chryseobacterium sp. Bi04]